MVMLSNLCLVPMSGAYRIFWWWMWILFEELNSVETLYCRWNTTMGKPIYEHGHNDCQQLITKSHGRSCLDSNIQPQEESNAYLSVKARVTVNVTYQCSENSYFWRVIDHKYQALCWVVLIFTYILQHITLSCVLFIEIKTTFFHCACSINHTFLTQ